MDQKNSGCRDRRNGVISGSGNHRKGRQILYGTNTRMKIIEYNTTYDVGYPERHCFPIFRMILEMTFISKYIGYNLI